MLLLLLACLEEESCNRLFKDCTKVSGAIYYLLSVQREIDCWKSVCKAENCQNGYFDCHSVQDPGRVAWLNSSNITNICNPSNSFYEWGIYTNSLQAGATSSSFSNKFFYGLWWGIQQLSSVGQNLSTSNHIGENIFAIIVSTQGLVPLFDQMDETMLDAICERLKPVLCTTDLFLVREGDPVKQMLFIIRGHLDSYTTDGGRTGFFNSCRIGPGDFCGEELLTWALDPRPSVTLPSSTRTVKANTEVEAFALIADDLKFVASQFRRLHSKQLKHKFRSYSHQWRTWAACFIQAAWRRHKKLKETAHLRGHEPGVPQQGSFWSRYAESLLASTRLSIKRRQSGTDSDSVISLEKPAEPNFSES
ncbi:hypothetical protein GH714_028692 [Hevea brasiliensis]|uniref:Cyclic nucleotide-binding domain-containing protein n=1 Tax=Hevea brasiliensis TaxID=3981 RepID=A0A6A6K8C6_HEVBR|nr:hypothetical protein GH714_028692 [Hevea brasiliensis]